MVPLANKPILSQIKSRLAPTPSGFLHQGNAFSFVLTWLLVRSAGGKLLLRIDDADTTRARAAFIEDIFYCLEWLGLDWDEGPTGPTDFRQRYSQELRFSTYLQLLQVLKESGQVYACNCSRSQIRASFANGVYGGSCRRQYHDFSAEGISWRVEVPDEDICFTEAGKGNRCLPLWLKMGDFVIRRKDRLPAYQIASLADDIAWGSNLVVRGEDLLISTAAQVFLATLLVRQQQHSVLQKEAGAFKKAVFLHHPLVLDVNGGKLSKSAGSTSLKSLREAGGNPASVYALVASYLKLPAAAAASLNELQHAAYESGVLKDMLTV